MAIDSVPVGIGPQTPFQIVLGKILGRKDSPDFSETFPASRGFNDPVILGKTIAERELDLQKAIDQRDSRRVPSPLDKLRVQQKAANQKIRRERLRVLDSQSNENISEDSEPIVFDSGELSPVFSVGPSIGVGILGINDPELRARVRKTLEKNAKAIKVGRKKVGKRKVKLATTSREKIFDAAAKLLKKIPKGLLPDAELVGLGKILGKAGAKVFGPGAIVLTGSEIIGKISEKVADFQFAKMEEILREGNAAGIAKVTKVPAKKPPKVPVKAAKSPGGLDPPRPRPPTSSASPGRGKVPQKLEPAKAKLPTQIKVTLKKRPLPKEVPFATPAQMGIPTNTNVKRILGAAEAIAKISKGAQLASGLGLFATGQRSISNARSFIPSPQLSAGLSPSTSPRNSPVTTGTSSGCYTVCRKPRDKNKPRKKPRICVTPAAAKKAGLI